MNADHDVDLQQLAADWQASPGHVTPTDQIRHYVTRRSVVLWSFAIADLVIGAVAVPLLLYRAAASNSDVEQLAMLSLASITIAAVLFGWWNRRGVLRASSTTIAGYLAISAERLRRMRTAWRIAWIVLASEVIAFSIWFWDRLYSGTRTIGPGEERFAWSWLAGFTLAAVFGLLQFARWIKRDSARLESLKRELERD